MVSRVLAVRTCYKLYGSTEGHCAVAGHVTREQVVRGRVRWSAPSAGMCATAPGRPAPPPPLPDGHPTALAAHNDDDDDDDERWGSRKETQTANWVTEVRKQSSSSTRVHHFIPHEEKSFFEHCCTRAEVDVLSHPVVDVVVLSQFCLHRCPVHCLVSPNDRSTSCVRRKWCF